MTVFISIVSLAILLPYAVLARERLNRQRFKRAIQRRLAEADDTIVITLVDAAHPDDIALARAGTIRLVTKAPSDDEWPSEVEEHDGRTA